MSTKKRPSFPAAFACILALVVIMLSLVLLIGGPAHIAVIISFAVTCIILATQGFTWDDFMQYIEYGGKLAISPALIVMSIGLLVASWIACGTVPMIIYYGLKIISPAAFLTTTFIVCSIVALASGSSWSTGATVGVALMGVGYGLGINPAMTAGAIISGAYFGDKMSPLSDTTILAPSIAEGDLFDHIKSMLYTTTPSVIICLILYTVLGMSASGTAADSQVISDITNGISASYNMNLLLLIPPVVVLVMAAFKFPSLPTILASTTVACILALIFQGESLTSITNLLQDGYVSSTGIAQIDRLLSRGGLMSMMYTASLTLIGISYGGVLEKSGILEVVLEKVQGLFKTTGSLIATTVFSLWGLSFATASQYLTIVLGGRAFIGEFKKKDLLPQVLSRTLEDAGTLSSVLIPWNLCGAFFITTLGVEPWTYVPYAFFCWLCPIFAMIFGFTGKFVWKTGEIPSTKTYADTKDLAEAES